MRTLLAISFLLSFSVSAFADEIYVWTDENGVSQTSTTKPPGWKDENYKHVGTKVITKEEPRATIIERTVPVADPTSSNNDSYEKRLERCIEEMERQVDYPSGTTSMSVTQRTSAEGRYQPNKAEFLRRCMGKQP